MELRTSVHIKEDLGRFQQGQKILSLGSCFAENIGSRLKLAGFDILINPLGNLFNPSVISENIVSGINEIYDDALVVERDGSFFHFSCHSDIYGRTEADLKTLVLQRRQEMIDQLKKADHLILTFGTAWVYRHLKSGSIVANCHKIPQANFSKECLNLTDMFKSYQSLLSLLNQINTNLKVLLTVSPVRHIKNGLHENNLSKAQLLLLANELAEKFDNISYFPAYELVLDDLRDYRFFEKDMIHPNELAVDYIYEKFKSAFFNERAIAIARLYHKIILLEGHRPRISNEQHQELQEKKLDQLRANIDQLMNMS